MSISGFDNAQARYDSMLPDDPAIFRCPVSGDMNEDCTDESHECWTEYEREQDMDEEPADFDDYKNGMGRYADDYWLDND